MNHRMDRKAFKIKNIHDDDSDYKYWMSKTPQERLEAVEIIREHYFGLINDGVKPRLQRVYTIIERKPR